jgi:hypothetical protein
VATSDDVRAGITGTHQLVLVVYLDQGGHPQGLHPLDERHEGGLLQRHGKQEHSIGARGAGLPYLVAADNEVLAQQWDLDSGAHRAQVSEVATERAFLGEDADPRRTALLVVARQLGRVRDLGQRALAGAATLDLRDHRDTGTGTQAGSGCQRRW